MTTTAPYAVTAAAGLPETELPDSLLARLPEVVAPAPWHTSCQVVTWTHPADGSAIETFPDAIRPGGVALVAWALVRYLQTPVGPYSEIAATLLPDGGDGYGHIPFIVVDSLPSIVGGRANWLLPKALADFEWSDDGLSATATSNQPASPAWRIEVRSTPTGEPSPAAVPSHIRQVSTDGVVGKADGQMSGSVAAALVDVAGAAEGPLAALLRPGRYEGAVLRECQFDVGPLTA